MEEEVKKILSETFFIDKDTIKMDSNLKDDLGVDSLSATSLILDLEDKYGIKVTNEELIGIVKVEDIVNLLIEKDVKV